MAQAQTRITQNGGFDPARRKLPAISVRVMTPIVFCASLVPCASATIDDVKIWPTRKPPRWFLPTGRRVILYASRVATNATSPATSGARTAGRTTFDRTTPKSTDPVPAPTSAAPMRPPNSACDDDDGSPRSQVIMFQITAPIRPAKIMVGVMSTPPGPSRMIPPEIVLATSVDRKAPTRLRSAATVTATLGLIAPVAIGVAIALAVS